MSNSTAVEVRDADVEQPALLAEAEGILAGLRGAVDDGVVPELGEFEALTDVILDAILAEEQAVLEQIVKDVRNVEFAVEKQPRRNAVWQRIAGRLESLLALTMSASDRLLSTLEIAAVQPNSGSHRLLMEICDAHSRKGRELADHLSMNEQYLSRLANDLARAHLVARRKLGREVFWEITARGEDVLDKLARQSSQVERSALTRAEGHVALRSLPAIGSVVRAGTSDPVHWDPELLGPSLRRAGRIGERSRAFFTSLVSFQLSSIVERLQMWEALRSFHISEPLEIKLLPPSIRHADIERLIWEALVDIDPTFQRVDKIKWSAPPPLWDGWAIVNGHNNRRGILFLDAKSQTQELSSLPYRAGTYSEQGIEEFVATAGKTLNAEREWHTDYAYRDPMMRLAFLKQLKQLGVDAWWLTAYFVDPMRTFHKVPASDDTWLEHFAQFEDDVSPSEDVLKLSRYRPFQIPEQARELVMT